MVWAAVNKVYVGKSARLYAPDLREAVAAGYITRDPHFTTMQKFFSAPETAEILTDLILKSSAPLAELEDGVFCADATGFGYGLYDRWSDKGNKRKKWCKVHIMSGRLTGVITALEIHDQHTSENPILRSLLKTTMKRFHVQEVLADAGYHAEYNYEAAAGIDCYIPMKSSSTPFNKGEVWERMYYRYKSDREAFNRHYRFRNRVESTISALKRVHGSSLRAKRDVAGRNECRAKALCFNIACVVQSMYEFGIDYKRWL